MGLESTRPSQYLGYLKANWNYQGDLEPGRLADGLSSIRPTKAVSIYIYKYKVRILNSLITSCNLDDARPNGPTSRYCGGSVGLGV